MRIRAESQKGMPVSRADGLAAEDDGHGCPADAGEDVDVGHREQVAE